MMKKLQMRDQIRLEMCRRVPRANLALLVTVIFFLASPLPISGVWYRLGNSGLVLALLSLGFRFWAVRQINRQGESAIDPFYRWMLMATGFAGLGLGTFWGACVFDPAVSDLNLIGTMVAETALSVGTILSVAFEPFLQIYFLIAINAPSILGFYLIRSSQMELWQKWFFPIFSIILCLHILTTSELFRRFTRSRIQSEFDLKAERENLMQVIEQLEVAQAEVNLQKDRAESSSRMAALGEMAGGIAHEINNPLTVIMGYADQIDLSIGDREPSIRDKTERMKRAVDRIHKIIHGLRHVTRDGSKDPFEEVTIQRILEDTIELCHNRFLHNHVELEVLREFENSKLICKPVQLSQVLLNLLNNAFDAVIDQPIRKVRMRVRTVKAGCQICIEDSGSGVVSELREKIFEPFFTTKPGSRGTGLGLSISKEILIAHDSLLSVADSELGGARFEFTLPFRTAEETFLTNEFGHRSGN